MLASEPVREEGEQAERRRTRRARLLVQVECEQGGDSVLARAQDLSEGGLSVLTGDVFEPGTEVVVRFHLPPDPPGVLIEARGVVANAPPGERMGIEFVQLVERQRAAIAHYVRRVPE